MKRFITFSLDDVMMYRSEVNTFTSSNKTGIYKDSLIICNFIICLFSISYLISYIYIYNPLYSLYEEFSNVKEDEVKRKIIFGT